jgi:predicted PurR-regulated permease PerM
MDAVTRRSYAGTDRRPLYPRAVDVAKTVEITISIRTLLLAAAIVAVAAAMVSISDALLLVFVGVFLAVVFEYPTRVLIEHSRLGRGGAATVVVLGFFIIVGLLALFFLVPLVGGVRDFLKDLPQLVEQLRNNDQLQWLGDSGAGSNAQEGAQTVSANVPDAISGMLGLAGSAFSAFLAIFTIVFLALFLVVDTPRLQRATASILMPDNEERVMRLWEDITRTIGRWAIGVVIIATIAGTVQGTTAALLGSSYALALGVIAGLLDMIPNIGATIGAFILVPAIWAEEGLTKAVIMGVVILVYQQVENNLITPTVQGKATDISAFFVILGVTVFGALLGVLGALVAVPLVASGQIVVRELTRDRRARAAAAKGAPEPEPA